MIKQMAINAKKAAFTLAKASSQQKNDALELLVEQLKTNQEAILEANQIDLSIAQAEGLQGPLLERLSLDNRLDGLIHDIQQVIALSDPVGALFDEKILDNHLQVAKCRTPLGVLGVIYESRPNVTLDISVLSIKSGNCAILRGGTDALLSNQLLVTLIQNALLRAGLPKDAIQLIATTDRAHIKELLQLHEYVDLIIPRGSAALQQFCRTNSTIAVITGGVGICHLFVDETADLERSCQVIENAKTQRPTVCNALDTVLVHTNCAARIIAEIVQRLSKKGVRFRLDPLAFSCIQDPSCTLAQSGDWDTEWLSLVLGIKIVQNVHEAIDHIHLHATGHSDGILTEDQHNADLFVKSADSAAVYVNASTRFTDGGQFGLGAEVAISTQKLHARGPMGLQELTSYKWIIRGNYQVRT